MIVAGLLGLALPATLNAGDTRAAIPNISLPQSFVEADVSDTAAPHEYWWSVYGDPALDNLIIQLHSQNLDIAQARAKLAGFEAAARAGAASQAPFATIDLAATQAQGPLVNAAGESGSLYSGRISVGWEVDVLGRLSGERAAEKLDAAAASALLADVKLLMEGQLVRAWLTIQSLSRSIENLDRIVQTEREAHRIVEQRRALGLISYEETGTAQRRLQLAERRHSEQVLARSFAARQIGFLLGRAEAVEIDPLHQGDLGLPAIAAGLPSELLGRRPDIAAARHRLMAADGRFKTARKSWLPIFGLTASGGSASPSLGQIISGGAGSFLLGTLFSIPVFDGGRHKARVAGRKAELDLAEAQYRETVLAALRDVNDRLEAYQVCKANLQMAVTSERTGATLVSLARVRAQNNTISKLAEGATEIEALGRIVERIDIQRDCLIASVDLLQALGQSTLAVQL